MMSSAQPSPKSPPILVGLLLSLCIIFLQVGFTYYWSFQTVAVLLILVLIFKSRPAFVNLSFVLLIVLVFSLFLTLTVFSVPVAISENSVNLFNTFIGVIGYALMIVGAPNLVFGSRLAVLRFFSFVSVTTILALIVLICVTDLELFPLLTRETLALQNATLITNFNTLEAILENFAYLKDAGLRPNMDIFYGEQSFLAIVLFACVTSRVICDKLLLNLSEAPLGGVKKKGLRALIRQHEPVFVTALGMGGMIYIQSFSSFFYVAIICISLFLSSGRRVSDIKLKPGSVLLALLVLFVLGKIAWSASDYYTHRFTAVSDSGSFDQRFSSVYDFGLKEYILGVSDVAMMPKFGFQNSILYVIGISGLGGLCLMAFVFYRIYMLAHPLKLALMAMACVFGVFSQNGGIFSPNKVVILSLVLLPLACVNRRTRKCKRVVAAIPVSVDGVSG